MMIAANLVSTGTRKLDEVEASLPAIVSDGGAPAKFAFREFFEGQIENDRTRAAYRQAVLRFFAWCESQQLSLQEIAPWHVSKHIKELANLRTGKPASVRTKKLNLAALRQFLDVLVVRHAIAFNPALSVKSPRLSEVEGLTPAIAAGDIRKIFSAIDLGSEETPKVIGLRDNALLRVLAYTGARSGAVAKLRLRDYYHDGTQWLLHFREKGGKVRHIPVRHDLQQCIDAYLDASAIREEDRDSPLFRATNGTTGILSQRKLNCETIRRMLKRRMKDAKIENARLTSHSYRVSVATDLLNQGIALADVQYLLGHADSRTTQGYHRGKREVTRNIVERISH